jgi:hypothetical protein
MNSTSLKNNIKMSAYLPKLFIPIVGNVNSSDIYRVIEQLGFGRVTKVNFRGNSAVVNVFWDVPNTVATRVLLQEGARPLSLYYTDNRFWKVVAFKSREEQVQMRQQEKPPAISWVTLKIQETKDRLKREEEEKQKNADPKQKEYDVLRAGLTKIYADCFKNADKARLERNKFIQQLEEVERLEKKRLEMLEKEKEEIERTLMEEEDTNLSDDKNYSDPIPEGLITNLDYGNVTEVYHLTRANIKARIGLAKLC